MNLAYFGELLLALAALHVELHKNENLTQEAVSRLGFMVLGTNCFWKTDRNSHKRKKTNNELYMLCYLYINI